MTTIKTYNTKLKSFKNTQKITKTMKMVSASKLRKAQIAQTNAKLYAHHMTALITRISFSVTSDSHPLLKPSPEQNKALILVMTSDKGLCGAFNHNANRQVDSWIEQNHHTYQKIDISCCGRKGYKFFNKKRSVVDHYDDVISHPQFSDAIRIGDDLIKYYLNNDYDEVYFDYNQFFSPLSQKTIFEKILPIDPQILHEDQEDKRSEYLFEPEREDLLAFLIPHFLYFKIYFALLENSAGEHGARMSAMDSATKNASDLIDHFTLLRNRARQTQITTELAEIISGAEALK